MMTRKYLFAAGFAAPASVAFAQDYPEREVLGVIMWSAGGATDVVARAVPLAAEEALGTSIVMLNRAGASGAIALA